MKKHKFNILPEIKGDDYLKLENDIKANGYDIRLPIYLYEGDIIDGWRRYTICQKLNIIPVYENFEGTEMEAIQFMLRTNKRRSLTSSQWATIANEATDIINELEKQAKERMLKGRNQYSPTELIPHPEEQGETREKVADLFNTNPKYVSDAAKIKKDDPKAFEEIKQGTETISGYKKKHSPAKKTDDSNPYITETVKLVNKAGDHVERILQKEFVPKTLKDFGHIDALNHGLYRFVVLAGESGVNIEEVWDKLAARHGKQIKIPEHLKRPSNLEEN